MSVQANGCLHEQTLGYKGNIVAVKDSDASLLKYLDKIGAITGKKIEVVSKEAYDESLEVIVASKKVTLTKPVAQNILVTVKQ